MHYSHIYIAIFHRILHYAYQINIHNTLCLSNQIDYIYSRSLLLDWWSCHHWIYTVILTSVILTTSRQQIMSEWSLDFTGESSPVNKIHSFCFHLEPVSAEWVVSWYEVGQTWEPIHKVQRRRRRGPAAQGTPENVCHHFGNLFSLAQNIQSFLAGSPPTM